MRKFYNLSGLLLILGIIALGAFVTPVDDDYSFALVAQKYGFFGGAKHLYFTWGGRFTAWLFLTFGTHFLEYSSLIGMMLSSIFLLILIPVGTIAPFSQLTNKNPFMTTMIIIATFFVSMRPYLASTVFWITGGINYTVAFAAGLLWLYLFKQTKFAHSWIVTVILSLSALFVSTMLEQVTIVIILTSFFLLHQKPVFRKPPVQLMLRISGLAIGSLILLGAPGNAIRAQALNTQMHYSLSALFKNSILMIPVLFGAAWKKIIICFLSGCLQAILLRSYNTSSNETQNLPLFKWIAVPLALSFGSLLPFILMGNHQLIYRYTALPTFILSLMAMGIPYYFLKFFPRIKVLPNIIPLIIIIPTLLLVTLDLQKAYIFTKQIKTRFSLIKSHLDPDKILFLPPITALPPQTLYFHDFENDPQAWTNNAASELYHIKAIQLLKSK